MSDAAGRLFIEIDADYAKFVQSWTEIAAEATVKAEETAAKVRETITAGVTKSIEETAAQVMASQDEMWSRQAEAIQRHMAKVGDLPIPGMPGKSGKGGIMDRFLAPTDLSMRQVSGALALLGKGFLAVEVATRSWGLAVSAVKGDFDAIDDNLRGMPGVLGKMLGFAQSQWQGMADRIYGGVSTDVDLFSERAGAARVAEQRARQQAEIRRLAAVEELERMAVIAGVTDEEERRRLEIENRMALINAEARRRVDEGEDYSAVERERRARVAIIANEEKARQLQVAEATAAAEFQIDLRYAEMLDQFHEQQWQARQREQEQQEQKLARIRADSIVYQMEEYDRKVENMQRREELLRKFALDDRMTAMREELSSMRRVTGEDFITRAGTAIGSFAFGQKGGSEQILMTNKRIETLTQELVRLQREEVELARARQLEGFR